MTKLHYEKPVSAEYQMKYNNAQNDDGKIDIPWNEETRAKVTAAIEAKQKQNAVAAAGLKRTLEDLQAALKEGRPRKVKTPESGGFNAQDLLYPFLYQTDIMDAMSQTDPAMRAHFLEMQQIGEEIKGFAARIR